MLFLAQGYFFYFKECIFNLINKRAFLRWLSFLLPISIAETYGSVSGVNASQAESSLLKIPPSLFCHLFRISWKPRQVDHDFRPSKHRLYIFVKNLFAPGRIVATHDMFDVWIAYSKVMLDDALDDALAHRARGHSVVLILLETSVKRWRYFSK